MNKEVCGGAKFRRILKFEVTDAKKVVDESNDESVDQLKTRTLRNTFKHTHTNSFKSINDEKMMK